MMSVVRIWSVVFALFCAFPSWAENNVLDSLIPTTSSNRPLTTQEAFQPSLVQSKHQISVAFSPRPGYYLYRHTIVITLSNGQALPYQLPAGEAHEDEFMGNTEIYRTPVVISLSVDNIPEHTTLAVKYQGCTEGLCYPPAVSTLELSPVKTTLESLSLPPATPLTTKESSSSLVKWLGFWLLGLGLAFTPCVYPMYPVLSAMLSRQGERLNWQKGLVLSGFYVFGLAITYTTIGLLVASAGAQIQGYLQTPWLLGLFSLFYIFLAISLFMDRPIGLPSQWQHRLQHWAHQQSLSSPRGVLFLGALSGLIGSPCTSAPLSGILLLITQSADPVYGGLSLFILSLGMGTPLIMLGLLGGRWMPKTGRWMVAIKQFFALLLLAMPLWLLERFIAANWMLIAWAVYIPFLSVPFIWLFLPRLPQALKQGLVFVALLISLGISYSQYQTTDSSKALSFTDVTSAAELKQLIDEAALSEKSIMIDVYADWCVACRELDEKTFRDASVQQLVNDYQRLRVDVTANTPEQQNIMQMLKVLGLPNVLFFNPRVSTPEGIRIDGYIDANTLTIKLEQCQQIKTC